MMPEHKFLDFKKVIIEKLKDGNIEAADLYVLNGMPEFRKNMILEEMGDCEYYLKKNLIEKDNKGNYFIIL